MFNLSKYSQLEGAPQQGLDILEQTTDGLQDQVDNEGIPDPGNSQLDPVELEADESRIAINLAAQGAVARMNQMAAQAATENIDPTGILGWSEEYQKLGDMASQYQIASESLDDETASKLETVAANDTRYDQVLSNFERELGKMVALKQQEMDQRLMWQQQMGVAAFNLKKHKIAQLGVPSFPVADFADLAVKFMDRLVTDDEPTWAEATNEILQEVARDPIQETEISDALKQFRLLDQEHDQRQIADLFGILFDMLPGHMKAAQSNDQTEFAMANKKPKGIIKFNLSDHINDSKDLEKKNIKTSDSGCKGCLVKTAADQFGQQYLLYGPTEKRICPKLRGKGGGQPGSGDIVSEYICRHHCLDGIVIDDNKTICAEALWRANVMEKQHAEYVDADGNIRGGIIEGRHEVNHNVPEENKMRLKPGEIRKPRPAAWGSIESRMQDMRNKEGKKRGYRPDTNTGQPFNWPQDADQNNVEVPQSERDRREEAMGHKTVQYSEKPPTENNPKVASKTQKGFNLTQFKVAQGGSIAPVVNDGAGDRPPFEPKDKKIKEDDHTSRKPSKKKSFNLKQHNTAKSPPGFEHTVEHMKEKHEDEVDNPFALAWWMKNKGYESHKSESNKDKSSDEMPKKAETYNEAYKDAYLSQEPASSKPVGMPKREPQMSGPILDQKKNE